MNNMNNKDDINVVYCTDIKYIYTTFISLYSLAKNLHSYRKINAYILTDTKFSNPNFAYFCDLLRLNYNCYCEFIYTDQLNDKSLYVSHHITKMTYMRMYIPELFKDFEKIVYFDSDIIILKSIIELYDTNLFDYGIGAVPEPYAVLKYLYEPDFKNYIDNCLKLKDITTYFNAGVLVLNPKMLFNDNLHDKFIEVYNTVKTPIFYDQCIFNVIFENKYKILDGKWNYLNNMAANNADGRFKLPDYIMDRDMAAKTNPCVLHFAGSQKPWLKPGTPYAYLFWQYARETPFYENVLNKMILAALASHK